MKFLFNDEYLKITQRKIWYDIACAPLFTNIALTLCLVILFPFIIKKRLKFVYKEASIRLS